MVGLRSEAYELLRAKQNAREEHTREKELKKQAK